MDISSVDMYSVGSSDAPVSRRESGRAKLDASCFPLQEEANLRSGQVRYESRRHHLKRAGCEINMAGSSHPLIGSRPVGAQGPKLRRIAAS